MLNAFTIRDSAAEAYMRPFFAQSPGAAIRSFSDLVNDPEHPIGQHPEDYTLFQIGEFEELSGVLEVYEPRSLGNGIQYVKREHGEQIPLTLEEVDRVS